MDKINYIFVWINILHTIFYYSHFVGINNNSFSEVGFTYMSSNKENKTVFSL